MISPVTVLRTRTPAAPTGISGNFRVRRLTPFAESSVVTEAAASWCSTPDESVKVTRLFAAVALNPVPVMFSGSVADAPYGLMDEIPPPATSIVASRTAAIRMRPRHRIAPTRRADWGSTRCLGGGDSYDEGLQRR